MERRLVCAAMRVAGTLLNSATVTSNEVDGNVPNNNVSASVTVTAPVITVEQA